MKENEHKLQVACVRWFRMQYPEYRKLLFAVPNGGMRHPRTAAKLKAEGVLAGVSDLILLVPTESHPALCIEMKVKGGRLTQTQKDFGANVARAGYKYVVCYNFEQFEKEVTTYLPKKGEQIRDWNQIDIFDNGA